MASLAIAQRGLEQWDAALANLHEVNEIYVNLGDREMIGRSFTELTDAFTRVGRFQEATETARCGLAYLQPEVSADRALLLAALAQALASAGGFEAAHEALREALNVASQLSDPKLEATLIGARSLVNSYFFRLPEAASDGFLSEQPGGSEAAPWQRALRLQVQLETLFRLGRPQEALKIADELEPLAMKIGQSYSVASCLRTRAWAEFGKAPDLAKLEAGFEQASKSDQRARFAFWEFLFEVQLSLVDFLRGNWASALLHAQACCRPDEEASMKGFGVGMVFRQMAYAGDHDAALAIFDEKRARLPLSGQTNMTSSWLMLALVIEGLVMLGEQGQAGLLYPLARELVGTGAVALFPLLRFTNTIAGVSAAAAGQWEAAEDHFQIATRQAESFPDRLEQAEIRRFRAMMLMDRASPGDREKAQTLLSEALETYTLIGMPRHSEITQALLDQDAGA